jgi:hypothetical protein
MSSTDHTTYDVIFVGGNDPSHPFQNFNNISLADTGGATACVTAGRLAEADPSLKILVSNQQHSRKV